MGFFDGEGASGALGPVAAVQGGSAVAGTVFNYLNSEKARKASKQETQRLEDIANGLQDPSFDTSQLTPEDYKLAQKYVPQLASYIQEKEPVLVKAASEGAVKGREAQMAALQKYRDLSATGDDVQSRILRQQALRSAQIQNQGQQQAIQQNFAQRGLGGSGMEYVSALLGQQGAGQQAQQSSQQAALDAYQNRLAAMRASSDIGGQIYGQDVALEGKNAAAINDFNQRMAASQQAHQNQNANTLNQAQQYNIGNQQAVMNANTAQKNANAQRSQDLYNQIQQQRWNAAVTKGNMKAGAVGQNLQNIQNNAASNSQAIGALAGAGIQAGQTMASADEAQKNRDMYERLYAKKPQNVGVNTDTNNDAYYRGMA